MKSKQMALCGLLTALAVVVMILAGAIGIGTFAGPVLAMAALLPVLEEYGSKAAAAAYAAATSARATNTCASAMKSRAKSSPWEVTYSSFRGQKGEKAVMLAK